MKTEKTERKIAKEKKATTGSRSKFPSETREKVNVAGAVCNDKDCPTHGNLKVRGKVFEGRVIKKFHKRVVIEFERMIYIRKYERYGRKKTKIHARLPICVEDNIKKGDLIKVQECRPLSKIIHFVVISKIKEAEEK